RLEAFSDAVNGKHLADRVLQYHIRLGNPEKTAALSQKIMEEGFRQATLHGLTFSIFDVPSTSEEEMEAIVTSKLPQESWRKECEDVMKGDFCLESKRGG
ncbi:MAG: hypothetical protein JW836_08790, partial [Deltaproteobacteria bacterium]|nr:hypothetical protein [Deltaproteobacteria bacterium]